MPVSTRSPRNKTRRKQIAKNNRTKEGVYHAEVSWSNQKRKEAKQREIRTARIKKQKGLRAEKSYRSQRGLL